jgi:hypothetical protein
VLVHEVGDAGPPRRQIAFPITDEDDRRACRRPGQLVIARVGVSPVRELHAVILATAAGRDRGRSGAGAVLGKFAKHRLQSGIADRMDTALPPGSGGVIAVYDINGAGAVDKALANAVKKSVAQIDRPSAKELKAGLAEAQAGMGG